MVYTPPSGKQKAMKKLMHMARHKDKALHGAAALGPARAATVLPRASEYATT